MLTGKDRQDWIEEQYRKYRKRNRVGSLLILVGGVSLAAGLLLVPSANLPSDIRQPLQSSLLILSLVFVFGSSAVSNSARKFLPPVEDRVLYRLKFAFANLRAYVDHGDESYKRKAIEYLGKVADALDSWTWGNLGFIRHGVGNAISEFRKNFRGRFIPAIERAKGTTVQDFFSNLAGFENVLESGRLNQEYLDAWNKWITQRNQGTQEETFPYSAPRPNTFARLKSRKVHLTFLILGIFGPSITYYLAVSFSLASRDTAFYGAIAVLGIVVSSYFAVTRRQKGN